MSYKEHYYSNSEYAFPLPSGRTYTLTSPFGYRIHPISGTKGFHNGTDFGAPGGTPVYTIADGKVILALIISFLIFWNSLFSDNGILGGISLIM